MTGWLSPAAQAGSVAVPPTWVAYVTLGAAVAAPLFYGIFNLRSSNAAKRAAAASETSSKASEVSAEAARQMAVVQRDEHDLNERKHALELRKYEDLLAAQDRAAEAATSSGSARVEVSTGAATAEGGHVEVHVEDNTGLADELHEAQLVDEDQAALQKGAVGAAATAAIRIRNGATAASQVLETYYATKRRAVDGAGAAGIAADGPEPEPELQSLDAIVRRLVARRLVDEGMIEVAVTLERAALTARTEPAQVRAAEALNLAVAGENLGNAVSQPWWGRRD